MKSMNEEISNAERKYLLYRINVHRKHLNNELKKCNLDEFSSEKLKMIDDNLERTLELISKKDLSPLQETESILFGATSNLFKLNLDK